MVTLLKEWYPLWGQVAHTTDTLMKTISRKYKYYEIFDISKSATTADIRKAYRILVKKYHPDVNSDPKAGEIVKRINKIYWPAPRK